MIFFLQRVKVSDIHHVTESGRIIQWSDSQTFDSPEKVLAEEIWQYNIKLSCLNLCLWNKVETLVKHLIFKIRLNK